MTAARVETAIRAAVVDVARTRVGRHYGVGAITPYGTWYGPGWERAYFCAAGWSWCWNMALGEDLARRIIGHQTHGGVAPRRRGFIWTVAIITQHRARTVPLSQLRPGDALMHRYNSGDNRQGNEVNHVDLVESNNPSGGYVDVIGFNVPQPGAPAGTDPSRGGGNWRRRVYYNSPWVVAGLQMPVRAAITSDRVAWGRIQDLLTDLGLADLRGTGTRGPATTAGVDAYADAFDYTGSRTQSGPLLAHMEATMSSILSRLDRLEDHVFAGGTTPPPPVTTPPSDPSTPNAPSWRRVNAPNGLNVRGGPGAHNPIVGTARHGDRFRVSLKNGEPVTDGAWTKGRTDAMRDAGDSSGWVATRYLAPWA